MAYLKWSLVVNLRLRDPRERENNRIGVTNPSLGVTALSCNVLEFCGPKEVRARVQYGARILRLYIAKELIGSLVSNTLKSIISQSSAAKSLALVIAYLRDLEEVSVTTRRDVELTNRSHT